MGLFNKKGYENFGLAMEKRRSIYDIQGTVPLTDAKIESILTDIIKHVPSAFNSQSTRMVLLLNDQHKKLWNLTAEELKKVMGPERDFTETENKINSFKAGYGTVLFFEDETVVKGLQKNFAAYADNFPIWSHHTNAMHQFAVWTAFATEGIGASLQHYNGVIDEAVYTNFDISHDWKLIAQMPFGAIGTEAGPKEFQPVNERFIIKK
ncbi:nitroreductase family protein [Macrococcus carouselicus]|uniref:Nitroreductase family protein n=1 Tax=Macrococcus carouselicus TaxID=69969 RepID=A0A9Q8CKW0_9STAP|nr:nitroreductase family protein [Macrococcus carouselicus]TDM00663.1 nitroreductase family protein [Macrococcus carouselicus]